MYKASIIAVAACWLACTNAFAQTKDDFVPKRSARVFVYAEAALGFGNFRHTTFNLHCQLHGRHSLSVGYCLLNRTSPATPDDFTPSTFLNFRRFEFPTEYLSGVGLTYGYVLRVKGSWRKKLRFPMRAGVVIGEYSEPYDFVATPKSWGDNYDYKKSVQNVVAIMLKPGIEFTPGRVAGFSTGGYVVLNKNIAACGVYFGFLLGKVSNHRTRYMH